MATDKKNCGCGCWLSAETKGNAKDNSKDKEKSKRNKSAKTRR